MMAPPPCLCRLDDSRQAINRRAAAAVGVAQGLQACGLAGPDRLVVRLNALVAEVMHSAQGQESAAVDYLAAALGRLVGEEIGRRAGLGAMPAQGRA